jgi:hypothetical protein
MFETRAPPLTSILAECWRARRLDQDLGCLDQIINSMSTFSLLPTDSCTKEVELITLVCSGSVRQDQNDHMINFVVPRST